MKTLQLSEIFAIFEIFIRKSMELDLGITIILIVSGIIVGAINTLAGGGSVVTVTMFTALGLPITIANGTNRIAVFLQNFTATINFLRKRTFDLKQGLLLSVPVIIGNIVGSLVATNIDDRVFKICFGVILVVILLYLIFDNYIKIKEGHNFSIKPWHYLLFLGIGFYGGYIYIGIGYLILAITLWAMRMDIMTANAIKNFVIFVATPFSLAVFIINGQIDYLFGIPHGVGNIIGSFLASHYASHLGKRFIKIFTLIIVLICFADLVGLLSLHNIFENMMTTVCK